MASGRVGTLQIIIRRLYGNKDEIRIMNSMNHRNTGCPLQVAYYDVVRVNEPLNDFADCILIDLGSHDD